MKPIVPLSLLLAAALPLPSLAAERWVDGEFVMMTAENCQLEPNLDSCYARTPALAEQTVDRLARMGAKHFLLPSLRAADLDRLAKPIKDRGLDFYTYEGWAWKSSKKGNEGTADCATYRSGRVAGELLPLKAKYGAAFAGLHYVDEPGEADIGHVGGLTQCVKSDPQLAQMKIFINLLPLFANNDSYVSGANPSHLDPPQYGVDCASGAVDNGKFNDMVVRYSAYAQNIAEAARPDYLAFNFYPFVPSLQNCTVARDRLLAWNMSIVSNIARSRGQVPVAYLQNAKTTKAVANGDPFDYANFHKLRWYASWFYAFGGRGLANYVSHSVCLKEANDTQAIVGGCRPADTMGLIDQDNQLTPLASDQTSLHGFSRQAQAELAAYAYRGFVDNKLSVQTGELVGWISNDQVLAGEYGLGTDARALVFFARRNPDAAGAATIGLNKWWVKVEQYDFDAGQWRVVGTSTNRIDVALDAFPGALYRLSAQ